MTVRDRIERLPWKRIEADLDAQGWAVTGGILTAGECRALAESYDRDDQFRSKVIMARHGFGRGEYKYFNYPLPGLVSDLRNALYDRLLPTANRWRAAFGEAPLPRSHADYLELCASVGQARPTPLLLSYGQGDYNCLHQDLYGHQLFPLQAAFMLSDPERDFAGGEFILTEQRPRMQSRGHVVPLEAGEAVIFAVNQRPVQGTRGMYRVTLRHGVSTVRSGTRKTLGVILHDAA